MSGPIKPQMPQQPVITKCTFVTPLQKFEVKFDDLHKHTHPNLHQGNEYGARLVQIDLETREKRTLGHFELNSNILK